MGMGLIERTRSLRRRPSNGRALTPELDLDSEPIAGAHSAGYGVQDNHIPAPNRPAPQRPTTANRAVQASRDYVSSNTIEIMSDECVFRFPTPSPRRSRYPSSVRLDEDPTIGIALGSPGVQSVQRRATPTPDAERSSSVVPSHQPSSLSQVQIAQSIPALSPAQPHLAKKAKSSTWKSFFGRKQSKQAVQEHLNSFEPPAPIRSNARPRTPTRTAGPSLTSRVMARQDRRVEKDIILPGRLCSSPKQVVERSIVSNTKPEPRVPSRSSNRTSVSSQEFFDALPRHDSANSEWPSPETAKGQGILDVGIPKHEMERYSVMFEKILKPQHSLLERRHGNLQKLRPVVEDGSKPQLSTQENVQIQRRATSPSLPSRPSPSLVLYRGAPVQTASTTNLFSGLLGRPQAPARSFTAPPGSMSPTTAKLRGLSLPAGPSSAESSSPIWSESSLPPTPTSEDPTIVTFGEVHTKLRLEQPQDMSRIDDSEWDLERRRTIPIPIRTDSLQAPVAVGTRLLAPSLSPISPDVSSPTVQVSVARQVSVSRTTKRPMQKPITVKQPLRPRIVDMGNRKSTLVLIEHA